jgi:hypothetical protein
MRRRSQPIGWQLTDPQLRIAPTIKREGLATLLIPRADAMEHSVAINPAEELRHRATAGGPASAGAGSAGAVEVVVDSVAVAAAEVVEEAAAEAVVDAAEVADDASWLFVSRPEDPFANRNWLKEPSTKRDWL